MEPAATGRPAYHPSTLLKLYIYGYLNRVQSSRRLEREAGRNLEVMWLLGMKRFVAGADRGQCTLLPKCLDDFIDESNPVRVIDAFVDALDLSDLGFDHARKIVRLPLA